MIIALVNFPLPSSMSLAEYKAKMMQTVPRYREMPALLRKNYIYDGERHLGGAVYVFETKAHAEACFSDEFIKRVTAGYGNPEIRYFETPILIDNQAKTVTELA